MARDTIIDEAIRRAGGITRLARGLGISAPSIYSWARVPAERVIAIAKLTGLPRYRLRPDLYPPPRRESAA